MIIGIDDTDSRDGMCTTYLAAVLIGKLEHYGTIKGYPLLIRLNPNIKYKTRGNAAIAITFEPANDTDVGQVKALVIGTVEEMAVFSDENTNPGVVFIEDAPEKLCTDLRVFSMQAVQDVLAIREAEELMKRHGISYRGFKNGRGLIGALAAAGFALCGLPDSTYELIAYREKDRWGTPREIDEESVWAAAGTPGTWDTVDYGNKQIVFAPHSPDPILFGIRGSSEGALMLAFSGIRSEPVERHVVYRTNQNTDMHLIHGKVADVLDSRSYVLDGIVTRQPETIEGGHVIFGISDNGASIDCAAFEPTKGFRNIIRALLAGDEVTVSGSVNDRTLNLEKIKIRSLNNRVMRNPLCCGKRMSSMGKGQGFRCGKCGAVKKEQELEIVERKLEPGYYEVPPCARRHLSKPLSRAGI
ncbi:MAG: tRNA(Ile)(2)-agmatinylcytidine synthase [Candidatus Methanoperedens sp.]|jgi:tRNA(Ile2)-agmatinylcytidine synthase|nr:tRNA(Ile)(2)-agmatinylcytidine synthase [Candidatus Methanoperedens sp.]PKL53100.1 MAG: tRNA(Ile2) 2-agmatinylcytidine synthetase [Candidatus Methanoperedenaceae archaeon HGW-Methanoperedenaceae-1]